MSHFSEYGIKKVVAIDDDFGLTLSEDTKIADLEEKNIDKIENLADFYYSNKNALLSDYFKEEGFEEDEIKAFFEDYNDMKPDYYNKISSEKEILFYKWVPEETNFKENIEQLAIEKERTFIVLDKVLTANPLLYKHKLREILNLISNVVARNHNLFFVFFSSQPEKLNSYEEVMDYLTNKIELDDNCAKKLALHINFVNKNEYDLDDFVSALRKSQKANFVNSLDEVYQKSIHTLKDRIWNINHNESLLHYDYLVEGQHIDTIIYDIFKSKFKYSFNEFKNKNYVELINPIRNSIQKYEKNRIVKEGIEKDLAPYRYRFLKNVNYAIHAKEMELKTSKSDDISYGDIIEINEKKYLVISQNCDITIRSNGRRKLQSFNLIEVIEKNENIDINWLKDNFINFFNDEKFNDEKLSKLPECRKIFEGMFYLENEETELEKMGFKKCDLKKIEEANLSHSAKKNLNSLTFDNNQIYSQKKSYDFVSGEILTVPCFWLDTLLLRSDDDTKDIVISLETIEKSKELRLATKFSILNEFTTLLEKMKDLTKESLDISLSNNLFNPIIPVKAIWNDDILEGFELIGVKRNVSLDDAITRKIHKKVVDDQVREAINLEILI